MKTTFLAGAVLLISILRVCADDSNAPFATTASLMTSTNWNHSPAYWDRILSQNRGRQDLRLGKSDYVVSGPIISSLRRQRSSADLSLGKRILRLPVVSWFVPLPMPQPPSGGGNYFRRGEESELPWTAIAAGAAPGSHTIEMTHEARRSLISVHK